MFDPSIIISLAACMPSPVDISKTEKAATVEVAMAHSQVSTYLKSQTDGLLLTVLRR